VLQEEEESANNQDQLVCQPGGIGVGGGWGNDPSTQKKNYHVTKDRV